MKRLNRIYRLGAIALSAIVLITLIAAPSTSKLNSGSTYNRTPNGYGAWYGFMQQRGTPVQRWQKPARDLEKLERPITLLRVNSQLSLPSLDKQELDWVKKGNTLVVLGVRGQVTKADFTTMQQSASGSVKIDTRRRHLQQKNLVLLGDRFGVVVWQENVGKGRAIFSTTPHLAANAYQDYVNNYTFLAQLLNKFEHPIWVDEYSHGYASTQVKESQAPKNWAAYLAQKPIFPALFQVGVLLLVLIWAQNRRFGSPTAINPPIVDNSQAYIQALAQVLQKAQCSEFILDVVGKQEQMQLQNALGLGTVPLDHQTLVNAWVEKTGRSPVELEQLLQQTQKPQMSEKDLLIWLRQWQTIRRHTS